MEVNSQCGNCTHLDREAAGYSCPAFPGTDGVPDEIVFNIFDHRRPHKDQSDKTILYEPIDPDYPTGFDK